MHLVIAQGVVIQLPIICHLQVVLNAIVMNTIEP
jgi:hypothetical protein